MKRTRKNGRRVYGNNNKSDNGTIKTVKKETNKIIQTTATTGHGDVTRHTAQSLSSRRYSKILCYIEFEENNQESRSPLWSRKRVNVERQTLAASGDQQ